MPSPDFFPAWVRGTHLANILFLSLMLRSGLQILGAWPKFYWKDDCTPGTEWLKLSRKVMPTDRLWTSKDEAEPLPGWVALPGGYGLGLGRHWHFAVALGWLLNGIVYVALLFISANWWWLVPTSWGIFPAAWHSLTLYFTGHLAPPLPGQPFNALQKLAYFFIVFILPPIQVATGLAMSPAWIGRFPWYLRPFGGKQGARSIHFVGLCLFIGFTIVHTIIVIIHDVRGELPAIVFGQYGVRPTLAIIIALVAILGIVAVHVAATDWSRRRPRQVQHTLGYIVDPIQRTLTNLLVSREHYPRNEISPYFRLNGYPPVDEEYQRLAADGFRDWRLPVTGLVEHPLCLSLDDLRGMERRVQVTKHNCIQGWTAIGEWTGVPLHALLAACRPLPNARYLLCYAYDDKSKTAAPGEEGGGYFYGTIGLDLAHDPATILAYDFNGEPLSIAHGAPLRLRCEIQLGFKMTKWIRAIELVESYTGIGEGQGGWREDHEHYSQSVAI
jgi:methionine sulfoxide reductase catalytic subunit